MSLVCVFLCGWSGHRTFVNNCGSIPLLWEQIVDLSYKSRLAIIEHEDTLIMKQFVALYNTFFYDTEILLLST